VPYPTPLAPWLTHTNCSQVGNIQIIMQLPLTTKFHCRACESFRAMLNLEVLQIFSFDILSLTSFDCTVWGPILIDCSRDPISEYHPGIQVKNDPCSRPTTGGDQPVHEIFRYVIDASGAHSATSGICEESRHLQMSSNNDPASPHPP
jgi:hypothetical protein